MGVFRILAAVPGFFLSTWLLMLLWGVIAPKLGILTISYIDAMLVNITLWLAVAPLAGVGPRKFCFSRIMAVIPGFFLSSWFLMLLWGVISPKLGVPTVSYVSALLITLTIWIAVAPLAGIGMRK